MKVSTMSYDELPEDVKEEQPDNGSGKEYANYIKVEIEGEVDKYYSDAMEPEDASFSRDLSWIVGALMEAYQAGKK